VFNRRPPLLVEGDDEDRVWQQAGRSSLGAIRVWPCVAGDVQSLNAYEKKARAIIESVYENARAYSLRDRDEGPYEIDDLGPVVRARLNCRASENLLLSDDVLAGLGTNWPTLQAELDEWISQHVGHAQHDAVMAFRVGGWNRRDANVKPLRNLLMALIGSEKPWEVAVGQAIAALKTEDRATGENGLSDFLGAKIVDALELKPPAAAPQAGPAPALREAAASE
jgi:hypothetical protein